MTDEDDAVTHDRNGMGRHRLERSHRDRVLGGVCAGIAEGCDEVPPS